MLAFCVNSSPAFLYTGIGISLFHSAAVGCIFLASSLFACLITGAISRIGAFYPEADNTASNAKAKISPSVMLFSAVKKGVQSMALICGFVVLFSACMPLFSAFLSRFLPQEAAACICGLLEVCTAAPRFSPPDIKIRWLRQCCFPLSAASAFFYKLARCFMAAAFPCARYCFGAPFTVLRQPV